MIDLIYYLGTAVLGGLIGYGVGALIAKYWDKAKEWFGQVWRSLKRVSRGVGVLIRNGNKLFKRLVVQLFGGEVEEYYDEEDEGVEIDWSDLTDEAKKALEEDEYIVVDNFES